MQKEARIVINCDTRKLGRQMKRRGTPSSFNSHCEVGNYFSQELESFNNSEDDASPKHEKDDHKASSKPRRDRSGLVSIRVSSHCLNSLVSTQERRDEKHPFLVSNVVAKSPEIRLPKIRSNSKLYQFSEDRLL